MKTMELFAQPQLCHVTRFGILGDICILTYLYDLCLFPQCSPGFFKQIYVKRPLTYIIH